MFYVLKLFGISDLKALVNIEVLFVEPCKVRQKTNLTVGIYVTWAATATGIFCPREVESEVKLSMNRLAAIYLLLCLTACPFCDLFVFNTSWCSSTRSP
jgi:hypothetical protein